jgi:hypothetical protein
MWKGTAATLNPKPTSSSPTATSAIAREPGPERTTAISGMFVVAVAP